MDSEDNKVSKYFLESIMMHFSMMIKKLFIIIIAEIILIAAIVAGFMWYISLPVEEVTESQEVSDIQDSSIKQIMGDSYGESEADKNIQEAGSTE